MDEQEFIAQRVKDLEDAISFFKRQNKEERERWVADAFLRNLDIVPTEGEIVSVKDDPPDVEFRDARFEIKEILDPGRRRHDEYKRELTRVREITKARDLLKEFTPKDIDLVEIYRLCHNEAIRHIKYSNDFKKQTDLLLYVNLQEVIFFAGRPYPNTSELAATGWRSVSFVMDRYSSCFYASPDAPSFIRQAVGHVSHRP
ncbi:DUF1780 domain-containing protein [Ralstonia mojiangensis]|uniref:DUF1780 domain-containing protein n=1 Tax=Ralstonia mojiangensis TaxID=2953895 RepID=UPI002090CE31|nr:DUF1780 domain-containing protein [Ralstonia mojiangensis]MCO5411123.1 DUF1780 domain-containing protein [Ralstonia mojiangensis]